MDPATVRPPRRGATPGDQPGRRTLRQRGQVLAIFAAATILFVGILAIVIDVSWYWANSLSVQRAADAAALAGVVWLPGHVVNGTAGRVQRGDQGRLHDRGRWRDHHRQQDSTAVSGGDPNQLDVTVSASGQHVLHAPVRHQLDHRVAQLQGALRPARADGQPPELLRRLRQGALPGIWGVGHHHPDDDGRPEVPYRQRHRHVDHPAIRLLGNQLAVRHDQGEEHCPDMEQLRLQHPQRGDCAGHPGGHDGQNRGQHMPAIGGPVLEQRHELHDCGDHHQPHDHGHLLRAGWGQ